jgi:hypothetical protein
MKLRKENQIPDNIDDVIGNCLQRLHAIPTWTSAKHLIHEELKNLLSAENYITFTAEYRDYHLARTGQSCLYDVPPDQHGPLGIFAGKRIRLVCGGAANAYTAKLYFAKALG